MRVYLNYRDKEGKCTGGGDPIDICQDCWPADVDDLRKHTDLTDEQIEEDIDEAGREGHDHPSYDEWLGYDCDICKKRLTEIDDWVK